MLKTLSKIVESTTNFLDNIIIKIDGDYEYVNNKYFFSYIKSVKFDI